MKIVRALKNALGFLLFAVVFGLLIAFFNWLGPDIWMLQGGLDSIAYKVGPYILIVALWLAVTFLVFVLSGDPLDESSILRNACAFIVANCYSCNLVPSRCSTVWRRPRHCYLSSRLLSRCCAQRLVRYSTV
jgi:apolipoprotein N-acyltransferase